MESVMTIIEDKVLSHFKWVTFPFLDGSAQKHPHPNPWSPSAPPEAGKPPPSPPQTGGIFDRGREYYLPTQFEKEPKFLFKTLKC